MMNRTIKSLTLVRETCVVCFVVSFCLSIAGACQQPSAPSRASEESPAPPELNHPDPMLKHRSPPKPVSPQGNIHLDAVVTDAEGKPVADLEQRDFTLLEDNQPRTIVSFQSVDGLRVQPDPPLEVILLIDRLNLTFQQFTFVRSEVTKFLRKNDGHLAVPVSIMLLSDSGLQMQPRPSIDGSALLPVLDQIKVRAANMKELDDNDAEFKKFLFSVQQLARIAEVETGKPGRKLLIWIGPGWPIRSPGAELSRGNQGRYFDAIVEITNRLREAHTVVDNVFWDDPVTGVFGYTLGDDLGPMADAMRAMSLYKSFEPGVPTAKQVHPGNLFLKVIATQSGGLVLGPGDNLVEQIEQCIEDSSRFYRISFDAPTPGHLDEYHDLKVQLSQPGLTARTNSGYYNQPPWK